MKVTIIGAGSVGATTAYSLLSSGEVSEIVLIDVNTEKALGEALDIRQAAPFLSNCNVYAGSYEDAVDSDVVVITSGVGRKPGQTRLELAQINVNILKSISSEIIKVCPNAFYILVANPVDVLTYAFLKFTGLPKSRVIGTGTLLDTIRLRTRLAEFYHVSQRQIHGNVYGEHGDSSFVCWSKITIAGVPLEEYDRIYSSLNNGVGVEYTHEEVESYVKKSGGKIIARKGCTVYGIATSVTHIVKALKGAECSLLAVSSLLEGEYGVEDVCLSTLALVGKNGCEGIVAQDIAQDELEKLHKSAEAIKAVLASVNL